MEGPDSKLKRRYSKGKGLQKEILTDVSEGVVLLESGDGAKGSPSKGKERQEADEQGAAQADGEDEAEGNSMPPEKLKGKRRRHRKAKRNDLGSGIELDGIEVQNEEEGGIRIERPEKEVRSDDPKLIHATSDTLPTKKRKRKQKNEILRDLSVEAGVNLQPSVPRFDSMTSGFDSSAWDWISLADPWHSNRPCISSKDGKYLFVIVSSSIKIYSSITGLLVSTLSPPTSSRKGRPTSHIFPITAMALNPSNEFQLITASLDGKIKFWDYLDATLLKTVEIERPVTDLCVHPNRKDELFISTLKHRKATDEKLGHNKTDVYRVSLKPESLPKASNEIQPPQKTELLGKLPCVDNMAISPSGDWLAITGEDKVYTIPLFEKKDKQEHPKPTINIFNSREPLSCLTFHPTDDYFATGDKKGQIRFWYCLHGHTIQNTKQASRGIGTGKRAQTKTLHWHAHAVSALAFSPNGAYLLSGGEESVLVIWSLENDSKVFIPRLGSPISWISCIVREALEYVLGLDDGTILMVNPVTQKVVHSISQLKLDAAAYPRRERVPLVYHKPSSSIILPSSHPSSLQMYSSSSNRLLTEIEVSPSNRVSRRDETPLEHARVEFALVDSTGRWLVTIDSRSAFLSSSADKREIFMKFWEWKEGNWILNTRIDGPHGESRIVDLAFKPATNGTKGDVGVLASSGEDGDVRLWSIREAKIKEGVEVYWASYKELETRSQSPGRLNFSPDGSLLAVAHPTFITLHDTNSPNLNLMDTVICSEIKSVSQVTFVGEKGCWLACVGQHELVLWDVIRSCVRWQFSSADRIGQLHAHQTEEKLAIYIHPRDEDFSSIEFTGIIIFDPNSPTPTPTCTRSLPFKMTAIAHSPIVEDASLKATDWQLVGITDRWRVILFGDHLLQESPDQYRARRPQKLIGQDFSISSGRNLFQDLFGKNALIDLSQPVDPPIEQAPKASPSAWSSNVARLFSTAPHQLPSVESLFDEALLCFLEPRPEEPSDPFAAAPLVEQFADVEMTDIPVQSQPEGRTVSDQEIAELKRLFREMHVPPTISNGKPATNGVRKSALLNGSSPSKSKDKEKISKPVIHRKPSTVATPLVSSSPARTGSKRKMT